MPKQSELTPRKKSVIVALSKEGFSTREISKRVKCDHSTVARQLKRYRETGSTERKNGRGRKRLSTAGDDRLLARMCLKD